MVQTPNPPPCTPSGISICLPVDFGGPPASPQLLEPPLTSPRPPSHGAVALSSTLLAMRAATLDEACLLSLLLMPCGRPRSGTRVPRGVSAWCRYRTVHEPTAVHAESSTARRTCAACRRGSKPDITSREEAPRSPPKRLSQPCGVRARGALLGIGDRCGAGSGVDCRPFYPRDTGAPT